MKIDLLNHILMDTRTRTTPPPRVCLWSWGENTDKIPSNEDIVNQIQNEIQHHIQHNIQHNTRNMNNIPLESIIECYTTDMIQSLDFFCPYAVKRKTIVMSHQEAKDKLYMTLIKAGRNIVDCERVWSELLSGQSYVDKFIKEKITFIKLGKGDVKIHETIHTSESIQQQNREYLYTGEFTIHTKDILCRDLLDLYIPPNILNNVNWDIGKLYGKYYHDKYFRKGMLNNTVLEESLDCSKANVLTKSIAILESYLNNKLDKTLLRFQIASCLGTFCIKLVPTATSLRFELRCKSTVVTEQTCEDKCESDISAYYILLPLYQTACPTNIHHN